MPLITKEQMDQAVKFCNYCYEHEILTPTENDFKHFIASPESGEHYNAHMEDARKNEACEFASWLEKRYGRTMTDSFYAKLFQQFKTDPNA